VLKLLAAKYTGKIIKSLFALWAADNLLLKAGGDLSVDYLQDRVGNFLEARQAQRLFAEIEDILLESLSNFIATEFPTVANGDIQVCIESSFEFVASSDFYELCVSENFKSESILEEFKTKMSDRPDNLSVSPQLFFLIGQFIVLKFLAIIETLPKFSNDALKKILSDSSEILDKINFIDLRIQKLEKSLLPDHDQNMQIFRSALIRRLGRISVFGVDSIGLPKRYDLSVAYVNLSMSGSESGAPETAVRVLSKNFNNGNTLTIVSGEPGSGKTTLLSWLALSIIQRKLPKTLAPIAHLTPVFIRLRDYAGKVFPSNTELLTDQLGVDAGKIDPDWCRDLLTSQDFIFLVDGYDELPDDCRVRAQKWLEDLIGSFENSRFVVTTRNYAVTELRSHGLLQVENQSLLSIEPMQPQQVVALVGRWYKAYSQLLCSETSDLADTYVVLKERLVKNIYSNTMLRGITRNPLVCSLICFVNTDRKGAVPTDRGELYRIATSALISRRDEEREIQNDVLDTLSEKQRVKILSFVSEYFYQRRSFQLSVASVVEQISEYLPSLGIYASEGEKIVNALIERSYVLRSPVTGQVDFAHKTFQEYFYALRIVDKNLIELVVEEFLDPDFSVTATFVLSVATPSFANDLVVRLLEAFETLEEMSKRQGLLNLQAALKDVPELDPELRKVTQKTIEGMLPPTSFQEAEELALAGAAVVELIGEYAKAGYREQWKFCVATLLASAEPEAIFALGRYSQLGDPELETQLIEGRSLFDRHQYNEVVLSNCSTIRSMEMIIPADLVIAKRQRNLEKLLVSNIESPLDWNGFSFDKDEGHSLKHLAIRNSPGVQDLGFLQQFKNLKTLEIYADVNGIDFSPIGDCKFISKLVIHSPQLRDLSITERMPRLTHVDFSESLNLRSATALKSEFREGKEKIRKAHLPYSKMYDEFELSGGQDNAFGYVPENRLDDAYVLDEELFGDAESDPFLLSDSFKNLGDILNEERNFD